MTAPRLPGVESLAGRLAADAAAAPPSSEALWQVSGPPTAGKTALLRAVAENLVGRGLKPVIVAPPAAQLDSAGAALVEISVGLKKRGLVNGESVALLEPRGWAEKLQVVRSWVEKHASEIVLLCDEPMAWPSKGAEGARFASHAEEVSRVFVETIACRRIVTGRLPDSVRTRKSHVLQPKSDAADWLAEAGAWGLLADAAGDLGGAAKLDRHSPLVIRLLVGVCALAGAPHAAELAGVAGRREIARTLADLVQDRAELRALLRTWARLSPIRRPFDESVLQSTSAAPLAPIAQEILDKCVLFRTGDRYVLHETLRLDVRERGWLSASDEKEVHRLLAGHYAEAFRRAPDGAEALRHELEAFHHATLALDQGLLERLRPFFTDQLDVLGRERSLAGDRAGAVVVFERSLEWDEENDYAHHYLAFNLDVQGREPTRVEPHYRRANELDQVNTWWRSRWINYLVTRGRMPDARQAWNEALDALGLPDPDAPGSVYENLHIWVARLLLHRGQLDFASEVLRGIPAVVSERHFGLRALTRTLDRLIEVRRARAVFPLTIAVEDWWTGPHLSASKNRSAAPLERWLPGRVDAINEEGVHLVVATPPGAGGQPAYGFLDVLVAEFDRWSRDDCVEELQPGRFVELAYYKDATEPVIRVHRARDWDDRDLPPLFPDPVRYLRTDGWVR